MTKSQPLENHLLVAMTLRGIRPFLFHRFTPQALSGERKEKLGTAGNDPGEWRHTVMELGADHKHQLYIDSSYVFSCLRDGAKFVRRGRGTLQAPLSATLQVVETIIPFKNLYLPHGLETPPAEDPTQPVYLDIRGVRNPVTRGRNVRYRVACASGWECTCRLRWDKTIVSREELESVAHDSGQLVGLGSGRSIGFGRFEVKNFSITELDDK